MNTFNALNLIPTVAAFRGDVSASREACKDDFARSLHNTLLRKLDAMTAALHDEVATEERFAADRGTPDGDFLYEIYHVCTTFERHWIKDGPISILDPIYEMVVIEDDCFHVPLKYTEVPAEEMEGLAEIMARIEQETRVRFVAARV